MNDINVAIAYFEEAIRESDEIIADCSAALQAELTEQKRHFEVALEAMKENERLRTQLARVSCDDCGLKQTVGCHCARAGWRRAER